MKKITLLCLSCMVACLSMATTKTYTADNSTDFWNPERGFYRYSDIHLNGWGGGNENSLDDAISGAQWGNMSLVFRYFYLDRSEYKNGQAITQADLDRINSDLNKVRNAGMKAIIRFSYGSDGSYGDGWCNFTEPSKAQMQAHMAQVKPILAANADVIYVVQAGFVGIWGEWYYSSTFGVDWSKPNAVSDRQDIINSLLDMVPSNRCVQLRTIHYITEYVGNGSRNYTALNDNTAFKGTAQSRLGHHNDAFCADYANWGTYYDYNSERTYLAATGNYVPVGGESAGGSYDYYKGSEAIQEMQRFHYDYMHYDYHPDVVGEWQNSGKYDEMKRRLGYRLQLVSFTYDNSVGQNATWNVSLQIKNDGFSSIQNKRTAYLVLKNGSNSYSVALASDPRLWKGGQTTTVTEGLSFPSGIPTGTYDIYLSLPDASSSIANREAYAIRLANQNMGWSSGLNNLGAQVTITSGGTPDPGPGPTPGPTPGPDPEHDYATSINFLTLAGQHAAAGQQSTDGIQDELNAYHYTIASSTDGEVYWDNQSGADGGLGIDNPNPSTIHTLSFWVRANYKVTITVGTLNGDGNPNTASLTMNGGSPVTIQQNTTTEYTTTAATEFVLSTLPASQSWSWNRIHEIKIESLSPSTDNAEINAAYLPSAVKYLQDGQIRIVYNGQIYDALGHPIY